MDPKVMAVVVVVGLTVWAGSKVEHTSKKIGQKIGHEVVHFVKKL